ncbi:MAG: phospho-sugar mutase [Bacillota bacterium]|nr:phospho-sugar mutase [Bacillota bacterium]
MEYKERYREWLKNKYIDKETKKEILELTDDEVKEAFYSDLEFGTGGIRGIMGVGTNRVNKYTIAKATQGLADFINSKAIGYPSVAICYDCRDNSRYFSEVAASVLAGNNIKTYIFKELRPTPMLSYAVRYLESTAGIIITASHNPPEYNGYKVYWDYGCQMIPEMSEELTEEIDKLEFKDIKYSNFEKEVEKENIIEVLEIIEDSFIEKSKTLSLNNDVDKSIVIVYTPLHGTGLVPIKRLLEEMDYESLYIVEEQMKPDGSFPTVDSPNPEDEKSFELAIKKAKEVDADIILSTDPDGDRLGVACKDTDGKYKLLTGNETGALFIYYILESMKAKNLIKENSLVIKTIVTSELGRVIAENYGVDCEDTLTGFKFIGEKIEEYSKTDDKNYIFGYEESAGYLIGEYVRDKDAVSAALIAAEMTGYFKKKGTSLAEELEKLYEKYGYYLDELQNIKLEGIEGKEKIEKIIDTFRNENINEYFDGKIIIKNDYQEKISTNFKDNNKSLIQLPESNVLKYIFEDGSSFVVRPSGTEPKLKIYYSVVDNSLEKSKEKYKYIFNKVNEIIDKV